MIFFEFCTGLCNVPVDGFCSLKGSYNTIQKFTIEPLMSEFSLNDLIGYDKEGNEINLVDVLKTDEEDVVEKINTNDLIEKLNKYLKVLTPREKTIIKKRYGLDNTKEYTQKEISKNLGISRSYVSRIEKRALTKILKEFIKHG